VLNIVWPADLIAGILTIFSPTALKAYAMGGKLIRVNLRRKTGDYQDYNDSKYLEYAFKKSSHEKELTNLGTSDNPMTAGSSHLKGLLVTEIL
jgi:hypothetical protein